MRAYIIEDEPHAQQALLKLVQRVAPEVKIQGIAATVQEGVDLIENQVPDFIFLDVKLGQETGFDLLRHFPEPDFNIIFVTAYDEYAVEAFKWNAIHYITKPIESTALRQALEKAQKQHLRLDPLQVNGVLERMRQSGPVKHLILAYNSIIERIPLHNIIRLQSDSGITHFYCLEEDMITQKRNISRKTVSQNIGHYANLLTEQFFRCHQSHIINRRFVQLYDKSQQLVRLQTGTQIPVSRRGKDGIGEWIRGT
ncbi:MAG: LytTR family DNA-binding domain-containing protein [Bacteroidota bacterium]